MKKLWVLLVLAGLFGVSNAAVLDDFESYPIGNVKDDPDSPWDSNASSMARIAGAVGAQYLVVGYSGGERGAFRAIPPIAEGGLASISVRIRSNAGQTVRFGLSDVAGYDGGFEIQLGIAQDNGPTLTAYDGATEVTGLATMVADQWYTLTIDIDQANDTFDLFLADDSIVGAKPVAVATGLSFVNGTTDDIVSFGALAVGYPDPGFSMDDLTVPLDLTGFPHNPSPENADNAVDSTATFPLTWDAPVDPNVVMVNSYDLYFYSVASPTVFDPNFADKSSVATVTIGSAPVPETLLYEKTYFWRVDANVTFDSNELTGTSSFDGVIEGRSWQFTTLPDNQPPVVDAGKSLITSMDLSTPITPAVLNTAAVSDDGGTVNLEDMQWTVTKYPGYIQDNTAMQMIVRTNDSSALLKEWIGSDGRNASRRAAEPLVLTISGLPEGTYSWKSYHHDPDNQGAWSRLMFFDADGIEYVNIDQSAGGNISDPNLGKTVDATVVSNGTDDVQIAFEELSNWMSVMNGFVLVGETGAPLKIDFGTSSSPVEPGFAAYVAQHEVISSFTPQTYSAFDTTVTLDAAWGVVEGGLPMQITDTTTDKASPTAEFYAMYPGDYEVTLTATDVGSPARSAADTLTVSVYMDSCAAGRSLPGAPARNYYDADDNCIVDLLDFVELAKEWMKDINLTGQMEVD